MAHRASVVRRAVLGAALSLAPAARGDALDGPARGARAVARAGATLVAGDDGVALAANPAALARRSALRVSAGLAAARQTVRAESSATFPTGAPPPVESRAGVALLPWGGVAAGLGDRWVVAAALLPRAVHDVTYATPPATFDAAADDRARFPQRYAGDRLFTERWEGAAGAAWRATPWLAVGAAAVLTATRVEHDLTVWAGAPDAGPSLGDLSPAYDLRLRAGGHGFAPGATLGVVIVPPDAPFELGVAARWSGATTVSGTPALADSRGAAGGAPLVAAAVEPGAEASLRLPAELTLRAGARLLLGRVTVEVDGELAFAAATPAWRLDGVAAVPAGASPAALDAAPLGLRFERALGLRGAIDVAIVPGALSLVAGAGWSRPAVADGGGPLLPGGDRLLVAAGVEGRVGGATVTLGLAQRVQPSRATSGAALVIDPRGPLDVRAAAGRARGDLTVVALDVEVELP